jgi:hypothetical protein
MAPPNKVGWREVTHVGLCVGAGIWGVVHYWNLGPFSLVAGFMAFAGVAYILASTGE